nr:MAG TPA: hypothetical protein [Caudoviricetes sp.]
MRFKSLHLKLRCKIFWIRWLKMTEFGMFLMRIW